MDEELKEHRVEQDIRPTAIHEAGHFVIGWALGLYPSGVTIQPDGSGDIDAMDPLTLMARWYDEGKSHRELAAAYHGHIIMMMAGREAEEELLGACPGGDGDDRYRIACALQELYPEAEVLRYERRLRRLARRLVRRHRSKIERIAALLIERGTLSVDQMAAP